MPSSLVYKKRGFPTIGDVLEWHDAPAESDYWCDICGFALGGHKVVYRRPVADGAPGVWCSNCAFYYGFDDLSPTEREPGDMDAIVDLYHFTDEANVDSIREHGLLSYRALRTKEWAFHPSSSEVSRQLDRGNGHDRYVRLSLHPHNRMAFVAVKEGRSDSIVWLRIDRTVLRHNGTLYSNTNAVSNGATINENPLTATRGDDQAEVLVTRVSPALIGPIVRRYPNG